MLSECKPSGKFVIWIRLASTLALPVHAHHAASEEIFGPVLSVMRFRKPEHAFERANTFPAARARAGGRKDLQDGQSREAVARLRGLGEP